MTELLEDIFYAVIALYLARRQINKQNISLLLEANEVEIDNEALEIVLRFVELVKKRATEISRDEELVDSRIVEFLKSQVLQRANQIELLQDLSKIFPEDAVTSDERSTACSKTKLPDLSESPGRTLASDEEPDSCSTDGDQTACYIYGVVRLKEDLEVCYSGLESEPVFAIRSRNLCALVHVCEARAYESEDEHSVKDWIIAHQNVLDLARRDFGNVIPMSFDTLVKPDSTGSAESSVREWLDSNYDELVSLLDKITGSDEYGVQITYETERLAKSIEETSEIIRRLKEEISSKPRGTAYFYREKLEQVIRSEISTTAKKKAQDFLARIERKCVELIQEEPRKTGENVPVLLKLSCLVERNRVEELGDELDKINAEEGFSVAFTGPWPPYSFVGMREALEKADETSP